ncbi:MAG TPA: Gfo/Idh/MocA family oxidoreductase [Blastocatellia bacterium]|nr:Gfo/Idh/MocA family oxidoreductase [Blastocatellia bacterium]
MHSSRLKGAIIGAGYFAEFQAEGWHRVPHAAIVAIADPVLERAQALADRWQIPAVYPSAEALLQHEALDFVDIATRPDSHLPLVELVATQQTHIICQKPMAPTWDECVAMVERCQAANVRLLMHENWRWQAWYREIKKLIEADVFGQIFHLSFCMRSGDGRGAEAYAVQPYFREMPRLLIYETLVHFLDTFRFLAGEITSVFCQTRRLNPRIRGEDYALIQLELAQGAHGLIDANRIAGAVPPEVTFGVLRLEGERASLRMTPQGDLFITEYGHSERQHDYEKPTQGYKGDSVRAAQAHYAACLRDGTRCESEGSEYLKTVRAMFACYESAERGEKIQLSE